jgi:hypothetical protein
MRISIDFGSTEEKKLIRKEFRSLYKPVKETQPSIKIKEVYFTNDLQKKVNELCKIDNYRGTKGINGLSVDVVGKIIYGHDKTISIVFSNSIFSNFFDYQTRSFIYLHELAHVVNKLRLTPKKTESYSDDFYTSHLFRMFDDYWSDRLSYSICENVFTEKTQLWIDTFNNEISGFIKILESIDYYNQIKNEIIKFRKHANVNLFIDNISYIVDLIPIITSHLFAKFDQYPDLVKPEIKSKFLNQRTLLLMSFFNNKYGNAEKNLEDGCLLIRNYLELFGILFEEIPTGPYCHVLDI